MVLARAERPSTAVETRRSPLDLERAFCIGIEFFDNVNAEPQISQPQRKEIKTFRLQDASTLRIERPLMHGVDFIGRPNHGDDVVISFSRGGKVETELRYDFKGLVSFSDDEIVQHRGGLQSEEERRVFIANGVTLIDAAVNRYFFPALPQSIAPKSFDVFSAPILEAPKPQNNGKNGHNGTQKERKLLLTGDKYFENAGYLILPPPDLGVIDGVFSDV